MRLAFVYFDNSNLSFKKDLVRYNSLLKSYFNSNNDASVVKKLDETLDSLLSNSNSYDILTEEETNIYNVIIDLMANGFDENELKKVQTQTYDDEIKNKLINKMADELPNIDPKAFQSVMEKSSKLTTLSSSNNIEIIFIPSAINVE